MTVVNDQVPGVRFQDEPGAKAMRKRVVELALGAVLLALSFPVEAQQAKKVPRIGYVSGTGNPSDPGANVEAFRQGLRDLGYVEGKNILVEYRYIEGKADRVPSFVAELVQLKVDVFVSQLHQQSAQPSKRPRRFPLSW